MADDRTISDADRRRDQTRTISDADRRLLEIANRRRDQTRTISDADRRRAMGRMTRSGGGTAESTMSDDEKRSFIVDVQGIGANTAAGLSGDALKKAYEKALRDAEKDNKRGMGGAMVDELGYMRGGMTEEKRGPIKYAVGGAIKGKNFKGSF
tara:strand:- start:97 stop:555 length:459 start_codon:yes stop_codon:yes gene_type:complete